MHCMNPFVSANSLLSHIKRHHRDADSFRCSFCPCRYPRVGDLESHLRTHKHVHSSVYPFCNKTSVQSPNSIRVSRHAKSVSLNSAESVGGQRLAYDTGHSYTCSFCNQKFSRIGLLHCHLSIHYGNYISTSPSVTGRSSSVACPIDGSAPNVGDNAMYRFC